MRASAFCPGHITGFFEICRAGTLMDTGSRGAGMCISLGATSHVTVEASDPARIDIAIDGEDAEAEVTRMAIEKLLQGRAFRVDVSTELDLPVSQGFGMSAAGALSASVALASILRIDRQEAFEAVHRAEVLCDSGLGDVAALHSGGVTVREKAGLPPAGVVHTIEGEPDVLVAVIGGPLRTDGVLNDAALTPIINDRGGRCLEELLERPTLDSMMALSWRFARETGLATDRIEAAVEAASEVGDASMVMLGNSVFAVGDIDRLEKILAEHGTTYRCRVDPGSSRLLGL